MNQNQQNQLELGVIESMISSIKENRRVRGEHRTMRDRGDNYSYQKSAPLEFQSSMSEEEHQKHSLKWKMRKRKSRINLGILVGVIVLIVCVLIYWLGM